MKNSTIIVCILFLMGCIPAQLDQKDEFEPVTLAIPHSEIELLKEIEFESKDQVMDFTAKYAEQAEELVQKIGSEIDILEQDYVMCGGVYFEVDYLYDRGTKFKIVGVTEKWIPIDGKVSKVLHLRLVD